MLIHISSGNGVDEVCRGVWHFKAWLQRHYQFDVMREEKAKCKHGIRSLLIQSSDARLYSIEGTILWRVTSPFRPKHKRKNWYFSVKCYEEEDAHSIDEEKIVYQTMKSPKKGGQHVNTTCSGVRAIYLPLGIEAIAYDERSQHRNRVLAHKRLLEKIRALEYERFASLLQERWRSGKEVVRGSEVLIFEGSAFREVH